MEKELKKHLIKTLRKEQDRIADSTNPMDFQRAEATVKIATAIIDLHRLHEDIGDHVDKLIDGNGHSVTIKKPESTPAPPPNDGKSKKERKKYERKNTGPAVAAGNKFCKKCDTEKSMDDFYNVKAAKDGKMGCCKKCWDDQVKSRKSKGTLEAFKKPDKSFPKIESSPEPKPEPKAEKPVKRMNDYRINDRVQYLSAIGEQKTGVIVAFTEANKTTPKGDFYSWDTACIRQDGSDKLWDRPFTKMKKLE